MLTDVLVIGAGVVGSSIAFELARAGHNVVAVDKAGGIGHGSTSASSAVVRFNFSTWAGVAAAWESKFCWEAWQDHLGVPDPHGLAGYERCGMALLDVDIAPRGPALALFDQIGVRYEEWDADTLRSRVPGIDTGRYWPPKPIHDDSFVAGSSGTLGAVYTPDAGYVSDPQLAAHNLAVAATHHGARFLLNRRVVEVRRSNHRVSGVVLEDGTVIESPVVVNAAGPWSGAVNGLAGVGADFTIGTRPLRQEVHHVTAPAGYLTTGGICIADIDLGTYLRPEGAGGLLVGGTEPACDPLHWLDDPDEVSLQPTGAVFEAQVTRAARRLTDLKVPHRPRGVVGVYDVADDWTPIYDRTELPGFYVAIGTSGNQFKNAPLIGRLMATLITQVENGHDHDADPVRLVAEHTGVTIDLGAFARRRPVNTGSTGTVMG